MTSGEPMAHNRAATTVSWWRAVRIEFALLARARHRFLLGALVLVLTGGTWAAVQARVGHPGQPPQDLGPAFMAMLLFTLLWSGEVWRDAPVDDRDWFWAQPIAQGAHELARFVAGLAWLALAALVLILLQLLTTVASGRPLTLDHQSPLMWVNLVTGPATFFLLGSLAGLRSAHPLRWTFGILLGLALVPEILWSGDQSTVTHAQRWVVWTLIGPFNGSMGIIPRGTPWFSLWLTCALCTLAGAAVAVVLAARVRRPS